MDDRGRSARDSDGETDSSAPYVSTGHLPRDERVRDAVTACHRDLAAVGNGSVSDVYPALAQADPSLFGIAMIGVDGHEFTAGDVDVPFALMSVAKPFVFALACARLGVDAVVDQVGVDATGRAFNSLAAVESSPDGRTNPMVNPGAIACTGLLLTPGHGDAGGVEHAWDELRAGLSAFAGRDLELDEEIHESARTTNQRNRAIGQLLHSLGRLSHPEAAVDLYTRQSSLAVTARDLAVIAKWADKMPEIRAIVKLQSYKFKKPDGKFIDLANTNRVLRTASYCDGMKTGYTDAAGYCLVATGERNGRRRIVVILNDTESGVWKDAQALLDWALKA